MKRLLILLVFVLATTLSACSNTPVECGEGTVAIDNTCEAIVTCDTDETYDAATNTCDEVPVTTCDAGYVLENGSCVLEDEVVTCDDGYTLVDDTCEPDAVSSVIELATGVQTQFDVGSTLPDFSQYFTAEGVTIDNSMIEHTLILDANNTMTTPGVFEVTITIGNDTKTISIVVTDSSLDYSDIVTEGVAGLYIDPSRETTFTVGDYLPNFPVYFIAYDGEGYLPITPDVVMHNLLLSADNRMIQAGSYTVWVDLSIGGVAYYEEVTITVQPVGNATVDSIGATGWDIQNPDFTDSDLFASWMIPSGDVSVTNTNGEVELHVNTIGMNFWDVLFAQPGKTFEKGYTYTITYRMKTGLAEGRDVVLFVEPSAQASKLLEEQVSLTTTYQDFTFTFTTPSNTTSGMVGVFLGANLPGAHPGAVMIDSITLSRTGEPIPDQFLEDLVNPAFTDADISMWQTEGQVVLSHNAAGYLEATVSGFTGAFYQDNLQLGGHVVRANVTYTVVIVLKTDVPAGRDVIFFIEDTNNNYAKYVESTATLTTDFTTFTYTFTPTVDNDDTKIGLFVGDMDNAALGTILIDSITITASE